jgi:hypothetical protein
MAEGDELLTRAEAAGRLLVFVQTVRLARACRCAAGPGDTSP